MSLKMAPRSTLERALHIASGKVATAFIGFIGLVCGVICTELYSASGFAPPPSAAYTALKIVNTSSTAMLLFFIARKYFLLFSAEQAQHFEASSRGTGTCRKQVSKALFLAEIYDKPHILALLIIELSVCAVHAPIGVSYTWISDPDTIAAPQSIDGTLTIIMLVRLYLFVPTLHRIMRWHSSLARVATSLNSVRPDDWFV